MKPYGRKYSKRCKNRRWPSSRKRSPRLIGRRQTSTRLTRRTLLTIPGFTSSGKSSTAWSSGIHKANKSSRQRKLRTHGPTVVLMVKVPPRTSSLDNAPTGKPTSFFPATSIPRAPTEHYSSSIPKRARRHRSTGRSSRASQARPLRSSRQNSYKSPNSRPQRNTRSVNSDRTWRSAPKRA